MSFTVSNLGVLEDAVDSPMSPRHGVYRSMRSGFGNEGSAGSRGVSNRYVSTKREAATTNNTNNVFRAVRQRQQVTRVTAVSAAREAAHELSQFPRQTNSFARIDSVLFLRAGKDRFLDDVRWARRVVEHNAQGRPVRMSQSGVLTTVDVSRSSGRATVVPTGT